MKLVVFLKQVPDNTKLKFGPQGLQLEGTSMMMNPFDEYALETALRGKEFLGTEETTVSVVSLGGSNSREILKKAIAVGAEEGYLILQDDATYLDGAAKAKGLSKFVSLKIPEATLLLFGQMSLDDMSAETGLRVAEHLNLPCVTRAKSLEPGEAGSVLVNRETPQGFEQLSVRLPAVVCMMKCDYELRSSNIKGVMKANKTEIPVLSISELGMAEDALISQVKVESVQALPAKAAGQKVEGTDTPHAVASLMQYLKDHQFV